MSRYSCTNQRYNYTPLRVEIIDILPKGTFLHKASQDDLQSGIKNPIIFTLDPNIYPSGTQVEIYFLIEDLPFIIGLPEDNPIEGLCWECQPDEVSCFDDNLTIEIPHPCAWYQEPYLYLCHFDQLIGPLETRLI